METMTAPIMATTSPPAATTMCQGGLESRSSNSRTPRITETTGFATETVATEVARYPVLSDTCWSTNAVIPVIAMA
jgi:hypothetical protein